MSGKGQPIASRGNERFFGLPLDRRTRRQLCDDICAHLAGDQTACFVQQSLNACKLPMLGKHPTLRAALSRAACLSPDGMGVVWAARMTGHDMPERVTGIDVMSDLLPRFEAQGVSIFLLGARPDVVSELRMRLMQCHPGLRIAGLHHGYETDDAILAGKVRQSGADALFVALPSPRKELFLDRFAGATGCRFAMGVGGAFDVLAGNIRRAPKVWQRSGLEFLWRIMCDPRVMLPRYVTGLCGFARMVVPEILRVRRRWVMAAVLLGMVAIAVLLSIPAARAQDDPKITVTRAFEALLVDDRQKFETWLQTRLAAVQTPADVEDVIAAILTVLVPGDTQGSIEDDGWQTADRLIAALLAVAQEMLSTGGGGFLLELVIAGVIDQLLERHPDPGRLQALIVTGAPVMAHRMFGDIGIEDGEGRWFSGDEPAQSVTVESRSDLVEVERFSAPSRSYAVREIPPFHDDALNGDFDFRDIDYSDLAEEDASTR